MQKEEIDELLLGADPELVLHKDEQVAPANQYFNTSDEFGCDGNSTVAELRPKPSTIVTLTKLGLVLLLPLNCDSL